MKQIPAVTRTEMVELTGPIKVGEIVRIRDYSYMSRFEKSSCGRDESWIADNPGRYEVKIMHDDFEVVETNLRMPSPLYNRAVNNRRGTIVKPEYLDTMVKDKRGQYWMTQKRFLFQPAVKTTIIVEPAKTILEEGDNVRWVDYSFAHFMTEVGSSHGAWIRTNASDYFNPKDIFQIFKFGLKIPVVAYNGIPEWYKGEMVYLDTMILDKRGHYWLTCEKFLRYAEK